MPSRAITIRFVHVAKGNSTRRSNLLHSIGLISVVLVPFAHAADDSSALPTAQPWAIRRTAGGSWFIVQDSTIAVPIPKDFINADAWDGPVAGVADTKGEG